MKIVVREGNFFYGGKQKNMPYLYQEHISFELEPGKIMAILGPNGAGKTTLLKCIIGLNKWCYGETLIDDRPLTDIPQRELWKRIGYIPQAHRMVFGFALEELVVMGRAPYIGPFAKPGPDDYQKARFALEKVGIGHLASKSCNEVSGGELQLALIARTLVSEPEVLILDEPESHLDIQKQVVILQTLKNLAKEQKISCIINTHYPNHAFYLADQVLLIAKRKKPMAGSVQEIMTEKQMQDYFNIGLRKLRFEQEHLCFETMVPFALATSSENKC